MSEFLGSTTTAPSEKAPPSSKIGANVLPRFSVLKRPPDAVATYQTFGFFGSISMSDTRPVVMSGPMLRSDSPFSVSSVRPGDCAPSVAHATRMATPRVRVRFMIADYIVVGAAREPPVTFNPCCGSRDGISRVRTYRVQRVNNQFRRVGDRRIVGRRGRR